MEIQQSEYKPYTIPEVNTNDSFWLWSLAKMSRDYPELWEFDIPKADAYELWLEENIKDNDIENVQVSKIAISSKEGKAFMNTFANDKLSNLLF